MRSFGGEGVPLLGSSPRSLAERPPAVPFFSSSTKKDRLRAVFFICSWRESEACEVSEVRAFRSSAPRLLRPSRCGSPVRRAEPLGLPVAPAFALQWLPTRGGQRGSWPHPSSQRVRHPPRHHPQPRRHCRVPQRHRGLCHPHGADAAKTVTPPPRAYSFCGAIHTSKAKSSPIGELTH